MATKTVTVTFADGKSAEYKHNKTAGTITVKNFDDQHQQIGQTASYSESELSQAAAGYTITETEA